MARSTCHAASLALSVILTANVLSTSYAAPQSTKLNDPLYPGTGGWAGNVRLSPDGTRVIYSATQDSQVSGLYSVPINGGATPVELVSRDVVNPAFARQVWENPWRYEFTPDGRIVYSDWQDLFAEPIDGSRAPVRLTRPTLDRQIRRYVIAPDGRHVVFTANGDGPRAELFSAAMGEDAEPVMLSGLAEITGFQFTPDGQTIVFNTYNDFHSVPVDGSSGPVQLNGEEYTYGHLRWQITPDGERVLYIGRYQTPAGYQLFSAPIDGSSPAVKLNGPLVQGGSVDEYNVRLRPRGDRVVYRADQEVNDVEELYSAPIDGSSAAVKLNGPVTRPRDVTRFGISPDGNRVVFLAGVGLGTRRLQSVPIDRSREPFVLDGPVPMDFFQFAAGGSRIVYLADPAPIDLYSVSILRGDSIQLTQNDDPYLSESFRVTPDGTTVVFANNDVIRRVPVDGSSAPVLVTDPFDIIPSFLQISPDGRTVVFDGYVLSTGLREIFSVPLQGGQPAKLNAPLLTENLMGNVTSIRISPDGSQAIFTVPTWDEQADFTELYSVSLGSGSSPLRLFPPEDSHDTYGVSSLELTPEGPRAVFRKGDSDSGYDLLSATLDDSLPVVQLNDPTTSAGGVGTFRLSGDGEWSVFTSYDDDHSELYGAPVEGGLEVDLAEDPIAYEVAPVSRQVAFVRESVLYSMPADASSGPLALAGPFPAWAYVYYTDLRVTASRAILRGDLESDEVYELFSAPLDGSSPLVKLSSALAADGDVQQGFQLSPDGQWVVYRADQTLDERYELFAAPADGSLPAVRLNAELAAGGNVEPDFQIDPLGTRALYRADQTLDERFELFAVPLDASAEPSRLNGPLVAGGDVLGAGSTSRPSFRVSSDGTRVVYRADQDEDDVPEVYSAWLDGSAGTVRLSGPLELGRAVLEGFQITPDGKQVLYVADQTADNVFELHSAPIGRAKGSRKLNGPLVTGGDVWLNVYAGGMESRVPIFEITPDSRNVLYLADQETDQAFELYMSSLTRPDARAAALGY